MSVPTGRNSLITFALFAYNQEEFVREAVAGALAQSYSPLEIILSDDCSTDNTFSIIQEIVQSYEGPHTVILNQTPHNMGLAGHLNNVFDQARGELFVIAAGDDISMPHRTQVLSDVWRSNPTKTMTVYSNATTISEDGTKGREWYSTNQLSTVSIRDFIEMKTTANVLGCSNSFDRRVWQEFGHLPEKIFREDTIFPFRAILLGDIKYVNEPLVWYRRHSNNEWNPSCPTFKRKIALQQQEIFRTWKSDLARSSISEKKRVLSAIRKRQLVFNLTALPVIGGLVRNAIDIAKLILTPRKR